MNLIFLDTGFMPIFFFFFLPYAITAPLILIFSSKPGFNESESQLLILIFPSRTASGSVSFMLVSFSAA